MGVGVVSVCWWDCGIYTDICISGMLIKGVVLEAVPITPTVEIVISTVCEYDHAKLSNYTQEYGQHLSILIKFRI